MLPVEAQGVNLGPGEEGQETEQCKANTEHQGWKLNTMGWEKRHKTIKNGGPLWKINTDMKWNWNPMDLDMRA